MSILDIDFIAAALALATVFGVLALRGRGSKSLSRYEAEDDESVEFDETAYTAPEVDADDRRWRRSYTSFS